MTTQSFISLPHVVVDFEARMITDPAGLVVARIDDWWSRRELPARSVHQGFEEPDGRRAFAAITTFGFYDSRKKTTVVDPDGSVVGVVTKWDASINHKREGWFESARQPATWVFVRTDRRELARVWREQRAVEGKPFKRKTLWHVEQTSDPTSPLRLLVMSQVIHIWRRVDGWQRHPFVISWRRFTAARSSRPDDETPIGDT